MESDYQKNWPLGYELFLMPPVQTYQTLQDMMLWTGAFYTLANTMKNYIGIFHYSVTAIKHFYYMKHIKYEVFPFWLWPTNFTTVHAISKSFAGDSEMIIYNSSCYWMTYSAGKVSDSSFEEALLMTATRNREMGKLTIHLLL